MWMSKILSRPMTNIDIVTKNFTARLLDIHGQLKNARIGYQRPHLTMPQIKHVLLACLSTLNVPKYLQYSAHDSQIANMWQFLGHHNWTYIPYASSVTIQLDFDPLCLEIRLAMMQDRKHSQFHSCFGVKVSANGQPIKFHLTPEQEQAKQTAMAGDYVTYDHFLRLMKANSYNQEGYATSLVNQNCKQAFVP